MAKKLRPSGGFRKTASFQTATIIYDATYWFCEKHLNPRSRTVDQMVPRPGEILKFGISFGHRPRAPDGRILPKGAVPPPRPRKPNCAS